MSSTDAAAALLDRAFQLLELGRLDRAEQLLRELISRDPENPLGHTLLALLLFDLDRDREAEDHAREAIALDPELPMAHAALARALVGQERFRDAIGAGREAVRLDPDEYLNHELLAACELARGDWQEARASAERALALEPGTATAQALRARALAMTGSGSDEWQAVVGAALRADPGSSAIHALTAHAHLTGGRERDSVAGFEEALRLDAESKYAQAGLAEALKAAHPLFRPLFRFFMWQERLDRRARIALIVVPLIAVRVLRLHTGNPVVVALLVVWFTFVVLTWAAVPIANVILRLSPRGRAILPSEQKRSSSAFALIVGGAVLAAILAATVDGVFTGTALALGFLAFSAGSAHGVSAGRRRALEIAVASAVAAAYLGGVLVSVGLNAGVFLVIASLLTGVALIWVVRFS